MPPSVCSAVLCAVLCCAVLCCATLCCAVLCYAVLCYAVLCCAVLCCAVLCCTVVRYPGEGYGPESIFQAITDLYAERIGHGFHLFSRDRVYSDKVRRCGPDRDLKLPVILGGVSQRVSLSPSLSLSWHVIHGVASHCVRVADQGAAWRFGLLRAVTRGIRGRAASDIRSLPHL